MIVDSRLVELASEALACFKARVIPAQREVLLFEAKPWFRLFRNADWWELRIAWQVLTTIQSQPSGEGLMPFASRITDLIVSKFPPISILEWAASSPKRYALLDQAFKWSPPRSTLEDILRTALRFEVFEIAISIVLTLEQQALSS